jgi:hypothetical protein
MFKIEKLGSIPFLRENMIAGGNGGGGGRP